MRWRELGWALAFVAGYVGFAAFALQSVAAPDQVALYWPATGLGLGMVVVAGLRWAPLVPLATLLVHAWLAPVPAAFLPFSLAANFFGALAGGWLARMDASARPAAFGNQFSSKAARSTRSRTLSETLPGSL